MTALANILQTLSHHPEHVSGIVLAICIAAGGLLFLIGELANDPRRKHLRNVRQRCGRHSTAYRRAKRFAWR
jgi:hypothetical protein